MGKPLLLAKVLLFSTFVFFASSVTSFAMLLKSRVYSQSRTIQRVWRRRRGDSDRACRRSLPSANCTSYRSPTAAARSHCHCSSLFAALFYNESCFIMNEAVKAS